MMDSVHNPNWENFKIELKRVFPTSVIDDRGSKAGLERHCNTFAGISGANPESFNLFNMVFKSEVSKLLQPPALISNCDAVRMYLKVFTRDAVTAILYQVKQDVLRAGISLMDRRPEDPYLISEIIEAAEKHMVSGAYDNVYSIGPFYTNNFGAGITSAHQLQRGATMLPFAPELPKTDYQYLTGFGGPAMQPAGEMNILGQGFPPAVVGNVLEVQQQKMATDRDVSDAAIRELKGVSTQFKEGIGMLNEMAKVVAMASSSNRGSNSVIPTTSTMSKPYGSARPISTGAVSGVKEFLCYMCKSKDHLMSDCDYYKNYIKRGWLVPVGDGSSRVQLRDGVRLPNHDAKETRWQKIEKIAKDRGWDKVESYFANVEPDDEEMLDQLDPSRAPAIWLTKLDEIASRLGNLEALRNDDIKVYNQEVAESGKNC